MSIVTSVKLGKRKAMLQILAKDFDCSVHSLILDAVDRHIEALQEKQAYDRRVMQAWENYQETGAHITLKEFSGWVKSLETDDPLPKPQCYK